MDFFSILIFGFPTLVISVDFIWFIFTGKRLYHDIANGIFEFIALIGLPLLYLRVLDSTGNDCCSDSATFSPDHRITIYTIIVLCIITFFTSRYREKLISPIFETLINSILIGGIIFNVFIAYHIDGSLWLLGNLSVILLFAIELISNQKKIAVYSLSIEYDSLNKIEKIAWKLLNMEVIFKLPILCVMILPLMAVLSAILLLFGQKPDSIVRGFTDTYKHGFSQLDYMCDNVYCGGHFLCSVAANGHKNIVTPERLGERGGNKIMCNRQLLIANAFEELIEEKAPRFHKFIRANYNKVGDLIHRYYGVFNLKWVADFVYVLMKPLEWMFLFVLYTFDQNPENRIAVQYLKPADRMAIKGLKNMK